MPEIRAEEYIAARNIIIDIARERRHAHVTTNTFREVDGEAELRAAVATPMEGGLDWEAAQGLLNELDQHRLNILRTIPQLETTEGTPTLVTATERFEAFVQYGELGTLDLKRFENVGNWSGADVLDREVDELIADLEDIDGYTVTRVPQLLDDPEACVMHLSSGFYPEQMADGLLYLARNTQKAHVVNPSGNKMHINKRTEFVVDLSKLSTAQARYLLEAMAWNGVSNRDQFERDDLSFIGDQLFFLGGARFGEYDTMIKGRHPAIEPINSTAYVYRDKPERVAAVTTQLPRELAKYPELTAAWLAAATIQPIE